jgi:hypothetical protein
MRGAPSLGAPRGSSSRRIHLAAFHTKGTLMKRRIALLAVAAAPTAIALIAAAFVSFASGSLSSPGPYGSTTTASAPNGAAAAAAVDTPNSPLGNRPPTASVVTTHEGGVRRPVERRGHLVSPWTLSRGSTSDPTERCTDVQRSPAGGRERLRQTSYGPLSPRVTRVTSGHSRRRILRTGRDSQ